MALKCIVTQTLGGPEEEMSNALSSLIQVGSALGRGGGFHQETFSGPFQPGVFCGSEGVGGVGGPRLVGIERAGITRRKAGYSDTRNGCAGETALTAEI